MIGFLGTQIIRAGSAVRTSGNGASSLVKFLWSFDEEEGEMGIGDSRRVPVGDVQVGPRPYNSVDVCRV